MIGSSKIVLGKVGSSKIVLKMIGNLKIVLEVIRTDDILATGRLDKFPQRGTGLQVECPSFLLQKTISDLL